MRCNNQQDYFWSSALGCWLWGCLYESLGVASSGGGAMSAALAVALSMVAVTTVISVLVAVVVVGVGSGGRGSFVISASDYYVYSCGN